MVRLSAVEFEAVQTAASVEGVTVTEYVRTWGTAHLVAPERPTLITAGAAVPQ
jgi:hypothetical protein